jgi:hypothetical protein
MVTRGVARIEANGAGVNPVTWVYGSRPRDERFFHSRALIGGGEILRLAPGEDLIFDPRRERRGG